ncbi:(6-4) photolyase [Novosphingobium marinum]|uniref:Deoxyribodipyrimidine photolyase-related protein n=1 Tax=Novosphingobium marinum TaxID=1514948 RepID=A0A7Z0BUN8_9SPHN|nr:cryptochrome/photolyase family protein [Novosphingobium marinum]NYH94372.1 deoxyribodipyrimidine photolyase-related protein [Novosphingobium marinum]GGC21836.1 (6-4) photolyase [Novosphingobium marinum]
MAGKTLVPILGDQLTRTIASLRGQAKADTVVLMMEVREETTYVKHHKQKIALILSAMRHFAAELENAGWQVDYVRLTDEANTGHFSGEVERAVARHSPDRVRIVEAGEWRVQKAIEDWREQLGVDVEILPDDRFLCSLEEFYAWAQGRERLIMENFYREMRRKTGILMDGGKPEGGQWNYDKDNRASPDDGMSPPATPRFEPDEITVEVLELVEARFSDHFGELERFGWPVTSDQAGRALDAFIDERLACFGKYQDAMVCGQDDLFHSLLSTSINLGILDSLECCERAEKAYRAGKAPLNAVEGFIRQIIGWREYIRGMYWLEMPQLRNANALNAQRGLPEFYWTGETDMRCLADCVRSTRENAHAHHIQRLMVLGNFALIAGVKPQELEDWFLVVYADAYEWVELPNVAAMALWADKGRLASKPYAASGNYINKMSDYCGDCRYTVSKKTGPDACPFNSLYWHFMDRHRKLFENNRRIARVYSTWDRMDADKRRAYLETAEEFLDSLEPADKSWAGADNRT